jgi:hypothetical protein
MNVLYRIWIFATTLPLLRLLLFTGGEGLIQLSIYKEISHDSAWTPGHTVGPSLDTRSILFVDENVTA